MFFIFFQSLFGKEADKLEHANDDEATCIFSNQSQMIIFRKTVQNVLNLFIKHRNVVSILKSVSFHLLS